MRVGRWGWVGGVGLRETDYLYRQGADTSSPVSAMYIIVGDAAVLSIQIPSGPLRPPPFATRVTRPPADVHE